ncbi:MAG: tyrosine-type recombinase/integrase [Acetatifactor sp.]|nr:tyrosine-type recombinase/integrase [Acetatifactor sp.]
MPESITQIVSFLGNHGVSVSVEMLEEKIEDMKRSQIIEQYGNKIKKIKDGRYHIRYKGRQIFKSSFDLVVNKILEIENEEGGRTLDSIAKDFFEYRFTTCAGGTYSKDKINYETFIKGTPIASKNLTKIIFSDGVKWANHCLEVKPNMREKYFKNVRGTLNQMLQFAIDNGWLTQNPVANVSVHRDHLAPPIRHRDNELVFEDWERFEVCRLANADANNTKSAPPLAIPLLFATGLRDGELCALKWRDVETKGLHIQSEMVEQRDKDNHFLGYKYVGHTKTNAGDRIIAISREVSEILSCVKKWNLENNLPVGQDDFIFLRAYRGVISPCTTRSFETRIKKYCRQAHMEVLKSQHDVRRTFATNLYHVGMNLKAIQKLMGHETVEQTTAYIKQKGENENTLNYLEAISSRSAVAV